MNLYTTKQLSELSGAPAETIRSWKQRGKYTDEHTCKDEQGNLLWTEAGLTRTLELAGTAPKENAATLSDANLFGGQSDNSAEHAERLPSYLDELARQHALDLLANQLPKVIAHHIERIASNPTEQEAEAILQGFMRVRCQIHSARIVFERSRAVLASNRHLQAIGG